MADFIESLSDAIPPDLRNRVVEELRFGWNQEAVKAKQAAKQVAIFGYSHAARSIDGIGELRARIPKASFHFWGHRLGYECWEDKQFIKEFLRDNPEAAVTNRIKRTVVNGASGIFDSSGTLVK
jgi:hypothetical protein